MLILSFGYTWPAFVAQAKTVTRRDWKEKTRRQFERAFYLKEPIAAWDKSPRFQGQKIGTLRLVARPEYQLLKLMYDIDYQREGFHWFHGHPWAIPQGAKQHAWAQENCSREAFVQWRDQRPSPLLMVIQFEVLSVESWAEAMLLAMQRQNVLAQKAL